MTMTLRTDLITIYFFNEETIFFLVWWQTADSFYFHFLKNILNPLNLLNPKNLRSQNSCRQGKIGSTRQGRRSINEENSDENSHENYIKNYNKQGTNKF